MRPTFLGLFGAAVAQYLRVFNDYEYISAYINPVDGSFAVKDDKSDAGSDFDYDGGKLVVPSGSLGYRDDGRVIVGGSEIPVRAFYMGESDTTGITPSGIAHYSFYICYSEEAPDTLYLYYINPDAYWQDISSSIDDGSETSTDDGGETSTDDGGETSTDDGGDTSTDDGGDTSTDDGGETSTDDGGETSTDNGDTNTDTNIEVLTPDVIEPVETPPVGTPIEGGDPDGTGAASPPGESLPGDEGGQVPVDTGAAPAPVETVPIEEGGGAPADATGAGNPLITEAPSEQARRVRRVRLARRESVAPEPAQLFPVDKGMCYMVFLELVPLTSDCPADDPSCGSLSCVTQCAVASCPPGLLCPPLCITSCPSETCSTICSKVSCPSGAICEPWCETKCISDDKKPSCETIFVTDRHLGSDWVPKWTVKCPSKDCVDVCTGCSSQGCKPLCTTSCPGSGGTDTGGRDPGTITGIVDPPDNGKSPSCRGTTCKCTTCPEVVIIKGCPTCVHTFTDWVFTCPLVTTITISTCTQNKCSPKTMTFLPGTHTVPGTAVVPVKNNILLTIKPGGTGGGGTGTGTAKAGGTGSAGTTTKPSGSGSGSTTAGNDASRNSLLGTFMGAVLFGLLMW